jgi:hypothetical protein
MGFCGLLVSAGYKPIASAGGEWRRGYEVGQSDAWALTGYTALELTSSRPMGVQGTKIHNRLWIREFVKIIKLGIITWALQTPKKPEK